MRCNSEKIAAGLSALASAILLYTCVGGSPSGHTGISSVNVSHVGTQERLSTTVWLKS
jgi:hypothetical protein